MKEHTETFEVRDSEIDIQGVVNNANYFIYLAHARHQYVKKLGISFSEMANNKQFLFLVESRIEYKKPLQSEDLFYVTSSLVPEGRNKFAFKQEIKKLPDDILIAKAHNICVCLDGNNRNRPYIPENIRNQFTVTEDLTE